MSKPVNRYAKSGQSYAERNAPPKKTVEEKAQEFYRDVLDRTIANMEMASEDNTVWLSISQPIINVHSNTAFSGLNLLSVGLEGYDDPRWITIDQLATEARTEANKAGLSSPKGLYDYKGEHTTKIMYRMPIEKRVKNSDDIWVTERDKNGKPIYLLDEDGKLMRKREFFPLLNASQIKGYPKNEVESVGPFYEDASILLERAQLASGVSVENKDVASFSVENNAIYIPNKSSFNDESEYYSVLVNLVMQANIANSDEYNIEQITLISELASHFVCAEMRFQYKSTAYPNQKQKLTEMVGQLKGEKGIDLLKEITFQANKLSGECKNALIEAYNIKNEQAKSAPSIDDDIPF